jgi:hypothetical protein
MNDGLVLTNRTHQGLNQWDHITVESHFRGTRAENVSRLEIVTAQEEMRQ